MSGGKTVLFYRDYRTFSGGHLKVWHYFRHLQESTDYVPSIYFSPETRWTEENPWIGLRAMAASQWNPAIADILFLAGLDWLKVDDVFSERIPIVNLIQHVKHADRKDPRYQFLSRRAIRICVSEDVANQIRETGSVNGPVFTVPNGLDTQELPGRTVGAGRNIKVFIGGLKNPGLASKLAQALNRAGISVHLETSFLPRAKFVQRLGSAEIAVLLPHRTEGFFLPALEAMALGAIVVCPDCVGNRSFCKDGDNCFAPSYKVEQILEAVMRALRLPREARTRMISAASETVALHSLAQERDRFLDILRNSNHMW